MRLQFIDCFPSFVHRRIHRHGTHLFSHSSALDEDGIHFVEPFAPCLTLHLRSSLLQQMKASVCVSALFPAVSKTSVFMHSCFLPSALTVSSFSIRPFTSKKKHLHRLRFVQSVSLRGEKNADLRMHCESRLEGAFGKRIYFSLKNDDDA